MVVRIETAFPRLQGTGWCVTSPPDELYNCIAWAVGDTRKWWWPGDPARSHWPAGVPRVAAPEAFREAFATLGYVACESEEHEPGFEKVALFVLAGNIPRHA